MNHPGDLLSALLDGEVTATERSDLDRHLAACRDCREELDGLAAARTAVRALPALEPPPGLLPEFEAKVHRFPSRPIAWAAAAAAAGLLAVGLMTGGDQGPVFDLDNLSERHTARVVVDPGISTLRASVGGP